MLLPTNMKEKRKYKLPTLNNKKIVINHPVHVNRDIVLFIT